MTGCTEFPFPCEAFQKHPSGPVVPVVKNHIGWNTKPVCKMFLALCCHLYHGFASAITLQLDILTRKQRMNLWAC